MTNQEQYDLIWEKAKKYDKLIEVHEKAKNEIDKQQEWLIRAGRNICAIDIAFNAIRAVLTESEG